MGSPGPQIYIDLAMGVPQNQDSPYPQHSLYIGHFHVTSLPSRLRREQKTAAMFVYNEIGASMAIFTK